MTAVHAMHVSWSAAHFSQERARAKMAEPVCDDKTWGGWKRWNINHRRGVYSSCHDNNNGSKTLSFLSPETNWHLIPFCSDTNWRDRRHGCRPTSPSSSVPCLVSDNVTNPGGRYFQLAHSHGENIQGVSLSVWWKMLDRSLHVLTVWRTSEPLPQQQGVSNTLGGHFLASTGQTSCIFGDWSDTDLTHLPSDTSLRNAHWWIGLDLDALFRCLH